MPSYLSFPVSDVARSREFYTALGWTLQPDMSSDRSACFLIADGLHIMALDRAAYEEVGGTEDLVGGPGTPSPVTVSFTLDSRDAVDALTEAAGAAGGRVGDTDEYPFMYQRQFDDPDGYHYSPFAMIPTP